MRRGSRRGSQRNGRASRALGARLHKQRAQCATVLDLSTVGVTGVRGQESQILVLGGVRPKQGAPKMKRPERRVLFHRTQPRLKLLQEGLQPTRRGRPRTQPHPVGRYLPGDTLSGLRPRTRRAGAARMAGPRGLWKHSHLLSRCPILPIHWKIAELFSMLAADDLEAGADAGGRLGGLGCLPAPNPPRIWGRRPAQ